MKKNKKCPKCSKGILHECATEILGSGDISYSYMCDTCDYEEGGKKDENTIL